MRVARNHGGSSRYLCLWIDAHADINTPQTTESETSSGCPMSFVMGLDKDGYPPEFSWVPQCLKPNKIAYIGEDVDDESVFYSENVIRHFHVPH